MAKKVDEIKLGYTGAIVSAGGMLLLSALGGFGIYTNAMQQMMMWHMFYSTGFVGTLTGAIEAALIGFIFFYAAGWIYNNIGE